MARHVLTDGYMHDHDDVFGCCYWTGVFYVPMENWRKKCCFTLDIFSHTISVLFLFFLVILQRRKSLYSLQQYYSSSSPPLGMRLWNEVQRPCMRWVHFRSPWSSDWIDEVFSHIHDSGNMWHIFFKQLHMFDKVIKRMARSATAGRWYDFFWNFFIVPAKAEADSSMPMVYFFIYEIVGDCNKVQSIDHSLECRRTQIPKTSSWSKWGLC